MFTDDFSCPASGAVAAAVHQTLKPEKGTGSCPRQCLFVCFLLMLLFCTRDHTQVVFGVILMEPCRVTQSLFERCIAEARKLTFLVMSFSKKAVAMYKIIRAFTDTKRQNSNS